MRDPLHYKYVTLCLTPEAWADLDGRARAAGKSRNRYARDLALADMSGQMGQAGEAEAVADTEHYEEGEAMSNNCPECQKAYTDGQLMQRDLKEAREELNYARQQAQQYQTLAERVQDEARSLATRLESAQRQAQRPDLKAVLQDPQVAAALPEALNKEQALSIARRHFPNLFEPMTLKF